MSELPGQVVFKGHPQPNLLAIMNQLPGQVVFKGRPQPLKIQNGEEFAISNSIQTVKVKMKTMKYLVM